MIPKRRIRQRVGIRSRPQIRCASHLQWVRGFVCAAHQSGECEGRTEAHHAREGANGGMGLKPDDTTAVPLCAFHHAEIHRIGWQSFEKRHRLDLSELARKLEATSPHRSKWKEIE
jgi:hypothetical protein